ncbi:hypothetical protein P4G59_13095 [Lactiplantibacillus plantarum]|uniref:hypothetical protein n=1 Tax=Lactiplantibacillus plantarum TaxID=1590 RepID=UPI0027383377|nr:hypothetical protein [Lactiplantibacillus plantarum]MDP4437323.1 hypothetical protein [Lactiplantibacillus plantarum]MDP4440661.1 hypothetical protein [Lactiplantibacillus plantarum]MDP4459078.1 hypothetical protein [Lactiplantibacillus plantarum]
MTAEEYEKNILSSKKTTVLQVMPGWSFFADDFTKDEVSITTNLAKVMHFDFETRTDPTYRFAKQVARNFSESQFIKVSIKLIPYKENN